MRQSLVTLSQSDTVEPKRDGVEWALNEDLTSAMTDSSHRISIESSARLHLGFVDLNGNLGRRFGSLGLALNGLSTQVTAEASSGFYIEGDDSIRAEDYALKILHGFGLPRRLRLTVKSAIPVHAGLGSGTQLALAVATAIAELFSLDCDTQQLAALTGRGHRSGIGIGVFETGGFVFDGGHAPTTIVPPVLARFEFPQQWRVLLVRDEAYQGLSGAAEVIAFESIKPMDEALAARLCRRTLLGVFPALVESDFGSFSDHIATIQQAVGAHFGAYQGGQFTSPAVADAVEWVQRTHSVTGVGQTSWGPTGFAFVEGEAQALQILEALTNRYHDDTGLRCSVHQAHNDGAAIAREERSNTASVARV